MIHPKVNLERLREWGRYLKQSNLKQARGALCSPTTDAKCCLGHAEDIVGHYKKDRYWFKGLLKRKSNNGLIGDKLLSTSGIRWFGFDDPAPDLLVPESLWHKVPDDERYPTRVLPGQPKRFTAPASRLNDNYRFTLREIATCVLFTADCIEAYRKANNLL